MASSRDPSAGYAALAQALATAPGVTCGSSSGGRKGFGSDALKVNGKIFAMLFEGRLVVKLPASRVAELVASGDGNRLVTGGRAMKEWFSLDGESALEWLPLSAEALAFVSSGTR